MPAVGFARGRLAGVFAQARRQHRAAEDKFGLAAAGLFGQQPVLQLLPLTVREQAPLRCTLALDARVEGVETGGAKAEASVVAVSIQGVGAVGALENLIGGQGIGGQLALGGAAQQQVAAPVVDQFVVVHQHV